MDQQGKPTIPEIVDRFADYLAQNPTWGSLHVVLEDGNVADSNVQFCIDHAIQQGDPDGASLANILLKMSKTQRGRIGRDATNRLHQRHTAA